MKLRSAPLILSLALTLAACQRPPTSTDGEAERRREEQIEALDERIARLQDAEKDAAQRNLAETERKAQEFERRAAEAERKAAAIEKNASVSDKERERLEKERQALLRERERLAEAKRIAEVQASDAERRAEETARQASEERQERTMDLFYTALEPHGEWLEVEPYGYVWQPNTASNPRWRPYTEGRWVFTEYGWTWKSNEPFGWAAYHYGRWTRIRRIGWIWVPGTEWGPAWVSWRRGDRFLGWAPLPPEAWSGSGFTEAVDSYYEIGPTAYTFVPIEEIGQSTYVGRVVEPERNVTIVNQTVNVTNIKYTKVKNNTVVYNGGPVFAEINAHSEQKVPQLNVERVTDVRSSGELGRAEQKGNTLVMSAPRIAPKKTSERPIRVREEVKAPQVERGWTDIEKGAAEETRAQFTKEARESESRQRRGAPAKESPRAKPTERLPATPAAEPKTAKPVKPATPEPAATPSTPRRKAGDNTASPRPAPLKDAPAEAPVADEKVPKATPSARQRPEEEAAAKPATPEPQVPARPDRADSTPGEAAPAAPGETRRRRMHEKAPAAPAEGEEPKVERRLPRIKRERPAPGATPSAPVPAAPATAPTANPASPLPPASGVEPSDSGTKLPPAATPADERKEKKRKAQDAPVGASEEVP